MINLLQWLKPVNVLLKFDFKFKKHWAPVGQILGWVLGMQRKRRLCSLLSGLTTHFSFVTWRFAKNVFIVFIRSLIKTLKRGDRGKERQSSAAGLIIVQWCVTRDVFFFSCAVLGWGFFRLCLSRSLSLWVRNSYWWSVVHINDNGNRKQPEIYCYGLLTSG